jgi:CBS-domain-containing membrane protein
MSIKYEPIPYENLAQQVNLQDYQQPALALETDPASSVMLDFTHVAEQTIAPKATLDTAIDSIQAAWHHILLVKNENNELLGLITAHSLLSSKPAELMKKNHIAREQMTVQMLMRKIDDIPLLTMEEVDMAKVGNVICTLHNAKRNHALVINSENRLCGILAATHISKQLHRNIVLNYDQMD